VSDRSIKEIHPVQVVFADQIKKPVTTTRVVDPVLGYSYYPSKKAGPWDPPEYNLAEIGRIIDVESYARQSFSKKIALMYKEGWTLIGKNPKTIKYIKARFSQISNATGVPTLKLFRDMGTSIVQKSNAFVVKVRDIKSSGGKVRVPSGTRKLLKPVAGYFIAPAETMEFKMTENKIVRWRQSLPDGYTKEFVPEDIVHMFYERKDGFIFGTPTITPVIDDIRALRKIEENIELLIYQHLFPLFQWKVGTKEMPAGTTEKGVKEVDIVKAEIQYMPTEGGIVTTERHEISAIGAEGRALRAESYLTHFKRRVFAGLGMSPVDLGETESSNRSTAEQLSQNLIDGVKDYQQITEIFINEYIIKELLLESNFPFDALDDENIVALKFKEIDVFSQIKKEAHYADQYNKDVVTLHEARLGVGREPIELPSYDEIDNGQDDRDKYPEWYALRWPLMERPKALINAVDEPYSNPAKARAAAESARKEELDVKKAAIAKKPSPAKKTVKNSINDAALTTVYNKTKLEIVSYVSDKGEIDELWIGQLIRTSISSAIDKLHDNQITAFRKGYSSFSSTRSDAFISALSIYRSSLKNRMEKYVDKLVNDTIGTLQRNINKETNIQEALSFIRNTFDSFSYRTKFIEDVEIGRANSFGQVIGLRHLGLGKFGIKLTEDACEKCHARLEEILYDTSLASLDDVPPFHANCDCTIAVVKNEIAKENIVDSVQDKQKKKRNPATMADCIRRMTRKIKKSDLGLAEVEANAMAHSVCESIATKDKVDSNKLERCVLKVKKDLRAKHADWSEDKIKASAFKICNSKLK